MQSQGSLDETSLKSLLETAQGERSTGTLTVRNGSGKSASLYFLFGHLFHAQSDGMAGDAAVVSALGWGGGEFEFDAKAKLPSDETVKAGIPELVQAAESGLEEVPRQPAPPPPDAPEERRDHPVVEKKVEAPQPRRGVKHRPQPKHGREPIPVPAGQVIYDSLKTSFVDFPRLITTLEKEAYTGIQGFTQFVNPVDLTEDLSTGNLYVAELGGKRITLLRPAQAQSTRVCVQSVAPPHTLGASGNAH